MPKKRSRSPARKRRAATLATGVALTLGVALVVALLWSAPSVEGKEQEVWFDTPGERYAFEVAKVEVGSTETTGNVESTQWVTLQPATGLLDTQHGAVLIARGETPLEQMTEVRIEFREVQVWTQGTFQPLRLETEKLHVHLNVPETVGDPMTIRIDGAASHTNTNEERVFQPRILQETPPDEPERPNSDQGPDETPPHTPEQRSEREQEHTEKDDASRENPTPTDDEAPPPEKTQEGPAQETDDDPSEEPASETENDDDTGQVEEPANDTHEETDDEETTDLIEQLEDLVDEVEEEAGQVVDTTTGSTQELIGGLT